MLENAESGSGQAVYQNLYCSRKIELVAGRKVDSVTASREKFVRKGEPETVEIRSR